MARIRLVALAALLGVLLLGTIGRADAQSTPEVVQGWTRSFPVPTFLGAADRIYVATDAGRESARAFVHVDLTDVDAETVELVLVESADPALGELVTVVLVCPLETPIIGGGGELSADSAPAADCTAATEVTRAEDGTWTIPVTGSDLGVALVPVISGPTSTTRLAFDTTQTGLRLTPAGATAPPPTVPTADPVPATAPAPATATTRVPARSTAFVPPASPTVPTIPAAQPPAAPSGVIEVAAALPSLALRSAASPPALAVLVPLALVTGGVLLARRRRTVAGKPPVAWEGKAGAYGGGALALALVPTLFAEATAYKLGLILIVVVAATGLHILVNWTGELSLGHAAMVGFPAFTVAKLSADHGFSPILLLPLGLAAGAAVGAAVGLPALRARGIQVALVTLAASVAIDRFFFTKPWFVGEGAGAQVAAPTLGPIEFTTSRSLFVLLTAVVLLAVVAAWVLYRSKLARGLQWVSANPAAAAAFGIPVNRYRVLAYTLAGAYAGLAGGLTSMWVQRVTPQAFPQTQSFTYLVIVALAGRGFLGGVALAAFTIEGGRLLITGSDAVIAYGAPLGLILSLTSYRHGLNGMLSSARRFLASKKEIVLMQGSKLALGLAGIAGTVAVVVGFGAIALAWFHAGNTSDVWVQNQEMLSGGIGGLALVVVGIGLVVVDRLTATLAVRRENDG